MLGFLLCTVLIFTVQKLQIIAYLFIYLSITYSKNLLVLGLIIFTKIK